MKPTEVVSAKKAYETPRLVIYGEIHEITQNVMAMTTSDGAAVNPMMT